MTGFRVADGLERLRSRLEARAVDTSSTPESCVDAMVAFYAEERAKRVDLATGGDMLLVQWQRPRRGPHEGMFELELVRQLSPRRGDGMTQLALTLRFDSDAVLDALPNDNRWFDRPTTGLADDIRSTPGFQAVTGRTLAGLETRADRV